MPKLNLELIKNLVDHDETVLDYIQQDFSKEILNGAEILGERALAKVEDLKKYMANNANIKMTIVASCLDDIAKEQGKDFRKTKIEAVKLSDAEMKIWRSDLAKSDNNYNKAHSIDAETAQKEIKLVKAEHMNDADAEHYLYEMDANSVDSIVVEFSEFTRLEVNKKLAI